MPVVKRESSGELIVHRIGTIDNHYFVSASTINSTFRGRIGVNNIYFPKEMIGKKVRLKIEVLDDQHESRRKKQSS